MTNKEDSKTKSRIVQNKKRRGRRRIKEPMKTRQRGEESDDGTMDGSCACVFFFYALGDVSWWTQEYGESEDYKQQHMFAIRE